MNDIYTKEEFKKEFCDLCGSQICSGLTDSLSEGCMYVVDFFKNDNIENLKEESMEGKK